MDLFTKFNRKSIDDRQIDTLIGISKGLVADGKVDQAESEFLLSWLIQCRQTTDNPVIINLLNKVDSMLEDGVLDPDESKELLSLLHKITGDPSEIGEFVPGVVVPGINLKRLQSAHCSHWWKVDCNLSLVPAAAVPDRL